MEKKATEFEDYLEILSGHLRAEESEKLEICSEIRQNLYDKQNEYLIKGYGLQGSVAKTLEAFVEPCALARMFNRGRTPGLDFSGAAGFLRNRRFLIAAIVASLLMSILIS